jgi:ATP-GRASP peptide maturase of grasp-with-spasm system
MILIISEKYDTQTDSILDWLRYSGKDVIRINDHDRIEFHRLEIIDGATEYQFEVTTELGETYMIKSNGIEWIWYRRGDYVFFPPSCKTFGLDVNVADSLRNHLKRNIDTVREVLHKMQTEKQTGNYYDNSTNKILNLNTALKLGIVVPDTIVVSKKEALIEFMSSHAKVITKGLVVNGFEIDNQLTCSCLTNEITPEVLNNLSDIFALSMFQEMIQKELELRVFFFNGKIFSVAMFTQKNVKTKVDFRNYDSSTPTRVVPFILPNDLESKIGRFMSEIKMTTGSLDFIVGTDGRYYFLEVNPVGQFGFISNWCNAILEREIANHIIEMAHGKA